MILHLLLGSTDIKQNQNIANIAFHFMGCVCDPPIFDAAPLFCLTSNNSSQQSSTLAVETLKTGGNSTALSMIGRSGVVVYPFQMAKIYGL